MGTSKRAVRGCLLSKVVFIFGAVLLLFAPPMARPVGAAEFYDFQICNGYFALCAASTCKPNPGQTITIRTAAGGTATFPEADCTCPVILGQSIANLAGGNMEGSCEPPPSPPGPGGQIWSTYQARDNIPQELTNWVPTLPEAAAPPLFCPAGLQQGNQFVQCFSLRCDTETWVNNVPVVTCHCPIGASQAGTPVPPATAFLTQAGQGDPATCAMNPVAGSLSVP
jgi:hypothetical protein